MALTAIAACAALVVVPGGLAGGPPPDPGFMGVPHCTVPGVRGLTLAKAKQRLTQALCSVGYVTRKRSSVKKGRVLTTLPSIGMPLAAGTAVDLVVSRGR